MKIIADSSTTRTEWVLVDGDRVVERAFTSGMNPFFSNFPTLSSGAVGTTCISTARGAAAQIRTK